MVKRISTKHRPNPRTTSQVGTRGASLLERINAAARMLFPATLEGILDRIGQLTLLVVVVVLPWHYGSVTWTDQCWLLGVAAGLLLCLTFKLLVTATPPPIPKIVWALVVLVTIGLIQLIPLPRSSWELATVGGAYQKVVTEQRDALLAILGQDGTPAGNESMAPLPPPTISIDPLQTRATLASLAAAIVFFLATSVFFRSREAHVVMLISLAVAGVSHAVLGVLQSVSWNGWTLLPMPKESCFSTFVSRNTAAQYYATGAAATISLMIAWFARVKRQSSRRYQVRYPAINALARMRRRAEDLLLDLDAGSLVALLVLICFLVAVFAAASRGGVLAWFGATVITLVYAFTRDRIVSRYLILLLVIVSLAGVLLVTLELDDTTIARLGTVMDEMESGSNARYRLWLDAMDIPHVWWAGAGAGTFHFAILPVVTMFSSWFYHAESVYVEAFADFGLGGLVVLGWGMACLIGQLKRDTTSRGKYARVGIVFAISAIALQSFVDFSLIIPAVYISLACLVGAWWAQDTELAATEKLTSPTLRGGWRGWVAIGALICGAILMGFPSLIDKARGEQLARIADRQQGLMSVPTLGNAEGPDAAIQLGRMHQKNAELLAERLEWPDEITDVGRLSDALLMATALRLPHQESLKALQAFLSQDPAIATQLQASADRFHRALMANAVDWRAAWGLARSDIGQWDRQARAEYLARVAVFARFRPSILQRLASTAFLSGEYELARWLWTGLVERYPQTIESLPPEVAEIYTSRQIASMLHDDPLWILRFARRSGDSPQLIEELLEQVNIEQVINRATEASHWRLVVWYAQTMENEDLLITAMRKVAQLAPQDHAIRHRLARSLEQRGEIEEAIRWMRQAERRSSRNPNYTQYRTYLEEMADQANSGG